MLVLSGSLAGILPLALDFNIISPLLNQGLDMLQSPFKMLFNPGNRLYVGHLALAYLIALLVVLTQQLRAGTHTNSIQVLKDFFDPKVWGHASARADYQFVFINTILMNFLFVPALLVGPIVVATWVHDALSPSPLEGILGEPNWMWIAIITIILGVLQDFSLFLAHWAHHKVPWLWEFHKTHHTAEAMTPITAYRQHPVEMILTMMLGTLITGTMFGISSIFFTEEVSVLLPFGINLLFFLFYALGYNLRHSHIWLDYGPFWSQWFVSPAMHQIHHSSERRHHDRNMGFMFSVFDRWFGTYYVPQGRETFPLGIDSDDQHLFRSPWGLYVQPFKNIWGQIWQPSNTRPRQWISASLLVMLILFGSTRILDYMTHGSPIFGEVQPESRPTTPDPSPYLNQKPPSLLLEELTWQEVNQLLKAGYTTVIVPTGGTEQNGPHVVLGKHNVVVGHTSQAIAQKLGHTLVAPVMAYVPEGSIEPVKDHMRFSGTLSLPEEIFEAVLEATARSLKAHGFQTICFVGDSGWNQKSQKRVADKLNQEWKGSQTRVIHVGEYYGENGQHQWLKSQGFTDGEIGYHVGIRDTSEMLALDPNLVRTGKMISGNKASFPNTGVYGDPNKATAALGQKMLDLKIEAAVEQIQRMRPLSAKPRKKTPKQTPALPNTDP